MSVRRAALFGVICAVLALGGCAGWPTIVFDESVPPEKLVRIYFSGMIEVTSYNGIPAPTRTAGLTSLGYVSEWHDMVLPAGEMEFMLDIGEMVFDREKNRGFHKGNVIYYIEYIIKDIPFRYTFEPKPGYYYLLDFTPYGGSDENTLGIEIYLVPDDGKKNNLGVEVGGVPAGVEFSKENIVHFFPIPLREENEGMILQ